MSQIGESIHLAWRDWRHEKLISLCAVLALASMLAPLLVLQGLKNGVTDGMRERLLRDPATLIITPKSDAGRYPPKFIAELAALPGAGFAIGRTRAIALDLTLENPASGRRATIAFEPAAPGEPVLARYGAAAPKDGAKLELVLTHAAAEALKIAPGGTLTAKLGRRAPDGRMESTPLTFTASAVLPMAAASRRLAFAPLKLVEDIERYRDYIAVPERGLTGDAASGEPSYASFRLYAKELDDVESLARRLEAMRIEVVTKASEIAAIKSLEAAINQIILIISIAVGAGFAAFMISSSEGAARRKRKMLGMLRLLGFRRLPLMAYPLAQALLTAACGFALSLLLYAAVAEAIAAAFAGRGALACSLSGANILACAGAVFAISFFSAAKAAWTAASLEPSMVIREV